MTGLGVTGPADRPERDHFERPEHIGDMDLPDGVGFAADPVGQDAFRVFIRVRDGRLADVKVRPEGCRCALASGSALAELALGRTLDEALRIGDDDVLEALGGRPDPALPRPSQGADALHRAVWDYLSRLVPSGGWSFWVQAVGEVTRVAEVSPEAPPGFPRLAEIEVYPRYAPALDGLEVPGHAWVLWWMHRLGPEARETLRAHPKGDPKLPEKGVFALRSPARPNPVGLRLVKVLERRGGRLLVDGLDALPGSPVLDLKPWTEADLPERPPVGRDRE